MKKIAIIFFLLMSVLISMGQELNVKGVVTSDDDGQPIPGVSVVVKGTTMGTITDLDGNYSLEVASDAVLLFTFIGMQDFEVNVDGQTTINVALKSDVFNVDEVVVVGYGVQKKSVITGAIASIKAEEIVKTPVASPTQALQGKTAGVTITNNSGQPGSGINIIVRGVGSNGNNTPLYIVDGIQVGDIDFITPEDIESIEVLKDAASAAIYGSRGANGVVLVTTKRGAAGKLTVRYNGYYGVQSAWKKASVLNAREYMMLHNEGQLNDGFLPVYSQEEISGNRIDTDWQDQIFDDAPITNHSVQLSGGNDYSTYMSSLAYFNQEGIVGGNKSEFERFTLRLNSDHKISDYVKAGNNLTIVRRNFNSINEQNEFGSILQEAILHDPLTPVYETDPDKIAVLQDLEPQPVKDGDRYFGISEKSLREIKNPLANIANTFGEGQVTQILANAYLEIEPIKDLKFKTDFGVDLGQSIGRGYSPKVYFNVVNISTNNSVSQNQTNWTNWQWENTLNYTKKILDDHTFTGLIGMSSKKDEGSNFGGSRTSLSIEGWDFAWLSNGADDDSQKSFGSPFEHTLLSYFGRLTYNYRDKYMASGIVRRDGSSRFGSNNQFGWFTSAQAGWVLTEEAFLKDNEFVSFLKLRASYGETGSEFINDFGYLETFSTTFSYPLGIEENPIPGAAIGSAPNPDLKWETAKEINFGLDATLFNSHIYVTLDFYDRQRKDLLSFRPIPDYTGVGAPSFNLGTVSNKGVEALIKYSKIKGDFQFDVSANMAYNKNEVTEVNNPDKSINGPGAFQLDGNLRMEEGFELPYFFGYKTDGLFQNEAEVAAHGAQPNAQPGDIRFIDKNGDKAIDPNDRQYIGSPHPDFTFGLTFNAYYKDFDFSMFWQGQTGNDIINVIHRLELRSDQNYLARYLERWTGEGTTNSFPRFSHADPNENMSRMNDMVHIEDGSYLRLKNIQLGYTLPTTASKAIGLTKLRLYVSGQNVFTITDYTGMDPEVGFGGAFLGYDRGAYPQAKTFLFGANITF